MTSQSKIVTLQQLATHFQDNVFVQGYCSYRIKLNSDPIPPYLQGTEEYRKWMDGWSTAIMEYYTLLRTQYNTKQKEV